MVIFQNYIYMLVYQRVYIPNSKLLVIEGLMSTRIFQLSVQWVTKPKNHGWEKTPNGVPFYIW